MLFAEDGNDMKNSLMFRHRYLLLIGATIVVCFISNELRAQSRTSGVLSAGIPVSGQSVIMGTWSWDIETNSQGRSDFSDVWWQQVDDVQQFLVPLRRAAVIVVDTKEYDSITIDDLTNTRFSRQRIENIHLEPGTVLALRTTEGNLAKIRIIGYRELHDSSFADAQFARPTWLDYLLTRPNRLKYHLEVEWTLYPRSSRRSPPFSTASPNR